jgi:RNA polymerase sigma-70 factor (ECF subfamily)
MKTPHTMLTDITSYWPLITNPEQFVLRYATAIRNYLSALVPDTHARDEVLQDFLLRVVQRGFEPEQVTYGRFRDYLKTSVRNAALAYHRRRSVPQAHEAQLAELIDTEEPQDRMERDWLGECRQVVITLAIDKLADHERKAPDSRLHTVLRLFLDDPNAKSDDLAARVAQRTGRPMSPEAFRKQLSRAREQFAALLIEQVKQTLVSPTNEVVQEELVDLGLLEFVKPFMEPKDV